jgi:branched-chain amino acid transport system ATP-binding protein
MNELLLDVQGLRAGYGSAQVLHDVDLQVRVGEVVGLLGRNGMGKTTLVHAITGILPSQARALRFAGASIAGQPAHRIARCGIALVPEGRQVYPNLSVLEHLTAFTRPDAQGAAPWHASRVFELFPRLAERRDNLGAQLSGGEQQMLSVARILRTGAKLLLLDEISEGLAPVIVQGLSRAIRTLREKGLTIVMVEQNFRFAAPLADRFYVIEHGRVIERFGAGELEAKRDMLHEVLGV